jgi:hypothetical protein
MWPIDPLAAPSGMPLLGALVRVNELEQNR